MENVYIAQTHVVLRGENKKELLEVQPEKIVCLHAADNYTRIFYYTDDEHIRSVLFRSSLKRQEEILSALPYFFRCHKRYLVNFIHVLEVAGNNVNLKLKLECFKVFIPVSRSSYQRTLVLLEQYAACISMAEG